MIDIIEPAKVYVQELMKNNDPSHDWYHVERVYKNAIYIANSEINSNQMGDIDLELVKLGALFHDAVDFKYDFNKGDSLESIAYDRLSGFFKKLNYPEEKVEKLIYIILNVSWRKELELIEKCKKDGIDISSIKIPNELKIVRDADRLDSIGATGVARVFAFTGAKNRPIFIEGVAPITNMSAEQYNQQTIKNESTAINHFHEKLLLLKDRMQTETGKKLANQRHQFMLDYLKQFDLEINP